MRKAVRLLVLLISMMLMMACGRDLTSSNVTTLKRTVNRNLMQFSDSDIGIETDAETESDINESEGGAIPDENRFAITFIDVGQGDSALVQCDGAYMLIDGGPTDSSSKIYSILKNNGISNLDYIVCTHAHEDHVGGLSGALNASSVTTALAPVTEYDSKAFNSFKKYLDKQNVSITVPSPGDVFSLGTAKITVLGPYSTDVEDINNTSLVLRIDYKNTSFLFTGDAEREEEQDILNSGADINCTVLKVGHHGSNSSTTYPFLREVMPKYAVISVGKGNSYGHPTDNTLSRLSDADVTVLRTDELGDISCTSDGETVTFLNVDEHIQAIDEAETQDTLSKPSEDAEYTLVANKSSMKVHQPGCSQIDKMKESNKEYVTCTMDEMIEKGYTPAKCCNS